MDIVTKTRKRLMRLIMLVTTAIIVAALIAVYWLTYNSQEANNRQRLNSFEEIRITENGNVSFDGEGNSDAYVVERTSPDIGTYFSMLVDNQGQILSAFSTEETQTEEMQSKDIYQTAADIAWLGKNYGKVELAGRMWQYSMSPAVANITVDDEQQVKSLDETYQIRFVDITESQQTLQTLALTLCIIGALLLLLFSLFSLFFSKRAIQPLIEVMEKQQQFVADASHELKTPVSIIKANCSVLYANEDQTISSQKEWLGSIVTGADRMTNLVQGLIALAKIEGTDNEIIKSEVQLDTETDVVS